MHKLSRGLLCACLCVLMSLGAYASGLSVDFPYQHALASAGGEISAPRIQAEEVSVQPVVERHQLLRPLLRSAAARFSQTERSSIRMLLIVGLILLAVAYASQCRQEHEAFLSCGTFSIISYIHAKDGGK